MNCRTAGSASVDCKKKLLERLVPSRSGRERREALLARPGDVDALVQLGTSKARAVAARSMDEIRGAMQLKLA